MLLCAATLRTCMPNAVIVGTVLSLINQADVVARGRAGDLVALKIAAD